MISTTLIGAIFKVTILAFPTAVASLALRRALRSHSANVWLYGATALLAIVSAFGVLPWAIGLAAPSALFLSLAAMTPVLWLAVLTICDRDRENRYDINALEEKRPAPLLLTEPALPEVPVFRHHSGTRVVASVAAAPSSPPAVAEHAVAQPTVTRKDRSVISVARAMRGAEGSAPERRAGAPRSRLRSEAREMPFLSRSPG